MLRDIVEVLARPGHRLFLRFEDGVSGEIALSDRVPFEGIFAALRDPIEFARVRVNPELGTVIWPNGADLDPDVLYAAISGKPLDTEFKWAAVREAAHHEYPTADIKQVVAETRTPHPDDHP